MDGSITLRRSERKRLLEVYRSDPDPTVRKRAQITLLLVDRRAWSLSTAVLFWSTRTIDRRGRHGMKPAADHRWWVAAGS